MSAKCTVKVVPGASRDEVVGWLGDAVKIRVTAPPEKGKANAAVLALLGATLDLPVKNLRVCSGRSSSMKKIEIAGMTDAELRARLVRSIG